MIYRYSNHGRHLFHAEYDNSNEISSKNPHDISHLTFTLYNGFPASLNHTVRSYSTDYSKAFYKTRPLLTAYFIQN